MEKISSENDQINTKEGLVTFFNEGDSWSENKDKLAKLKFGSR